MFGKNWFLFLFPHELKFLLSYFEMKLLATHKVKNELFPWWRCLNYGPLGCWYYGSGSILPTTCFDDVIMIDASVRKCDSTEDLIAIPLIFIFVILLGYNKCQEPNLRRNLPASKHAVVLRRLIDFTSHWRGLDELIDFMSH